MSVKITANIELRGGTMYKESKNHKLYDHGTMVVEGRTNGKKNPNDKETIHFFTRKCIPATQTINMPDEAYEYMSSNEIPEFSNKSTWSKLSKKQRVEAHLKEVAEALNGKLIDFIIYPD